MKPLLAATAKSMSDIKFPCYCTPKIDGIRCLTMEGQGVSRSLKPIRNEFIQKKLSTLPDGLDGELLLRAGGSFSKISSAVMGSLGEPDFVYAVFDLWNCATVVGGNSRANCYLKRIEILKGLKLPKWVTLLIPKTLHNEKDLLAYETKCLSEGFEGVMIRNDGAYKHGRSTVNEGYLLKWKRFEDGEAHILAFVEQLENQNVKTRDNLGHGQRSSHKENMVPKGTLGALEVKDCKTGVEFKIGTGFDDVMRANVWDNPDRYIDRIVKYKSQPHGEKDKPRFPVFLGFRDKEDM